jgi:hypothetical protein
MTDKQNKKKKSFVRLSQMPCDMRGSLSNLVREFDENGDGCIYEKDFVEAVRTLKKSREGNHRLKKIVSALLLATLLLAGGTFGLSLAAAILAKDSKMDSDGTVYSKKSKNVMKTSEATVSKENVTVTALSNDELNDLKYMSLANDDIFFYVQGHSRSSSGDKVTLVLEGGAMITFDDVGISNSTGYAFDFLNEHGLMSPSDGDRSLVFTPGSPGTFQFVPASPTTNSFTAFGG